MRGVSHIPYTRCLCPGHWHWSPGDQRPFTSHTFHSDMFYFMRSQEYQRSSQERTPRRTQVKITRPQRKYIDKVLPKATLHHWSSVSSWDLCTCPKGLTHPYTRLCFTLTNHCTSLLDRLKDCTRLVWKRRHTWDPRLTAYPSATRTRT